MLSKSAPISPMRHGRLQYTPEVTLPPFEVWRQRRISQLTTMPVRPARPTRVLAEDSMPGWAKTDNAWPPPTPTKPEDEWLNSVSAARIWTGDLPRTSSLDQLKELAQRSPDEDTLEVPAITRRRREEGE